MATALYPSLFSVNPMILPQQQQPPQPTVPSSSSGAGGSAAAAALRRAVYVHVSDLTSAYNIDHVKLEEELARVKTEHEERQLRDEAVSSQRDDPALGGASGGGAAASAVLGGVPTELDTSGAAQRRLQPPRAGYNLCVLVGKVTVVVDKRRVDGTRVRLAEVEVGDETGMASFRARDDQIDVLDEVSNRGSAVVLRNCTVEMYQGKHIRLAVTKWGKISRYPDQVPSTPAPPSKINRDRNFSLIDLSKVASESMANAPGGPDSYHHHHHHHHQGLENENQANRPQQQQQQQQAYGNSGRGRGRRPPGAAMRSAKPMAASGHYHEGPGLSGPPVSYPPGGLHGYGGIDPGPSPYLYQTRPPDPLSAQHPHPPPHHLMHHPPPPYDLQQQQQQQQQQQAQQQAHLRPMHQPPPPPPQHLYPGPQDRMNAGAMAPQGGLAPASSFDSAFGLPTMSNPFMVPIASSSASSTSTHVAPMGGGPSTPTTARPDSPGARMNPQAPTFDPSLAYRK